MCASMSIARVYIVSRITYPYPYPHTYTPYTVSYRIAYIANSRYIYRIYSVSISSISRSSLRCIAETRKGLRIDDRSNTYT